MSTSERAFAQVKSILGKLDRSIDAARERRLQGGPGGGRETVVGAPAPAMNAAVVPVQPVASPAPINGKPGGYGRATPLRPTNG